MFSCAGCGKSDLPLIRNMCQECDPDLHELRQRVARYLLEAEGKFGEQTGQDALNSWGQFEDWLKSNSEGAGKLVYEAIKDYILIDPETAEKIAAAKEGEG